MCLDCRGTNAGVIKAALKGFAEVCSELRELQMKVDKYDKILSAFKFSFDKTIESKPSPCKQDKSLNFNDCVNTTETVSPDYFSAGSDCSSSYSDEASGRAQQPLVSRKALAKTSKSCSQTSTLISNIITFSSNLVNNNIEIVT